MKKILRIVAAGSVVFCLILIWLILRKPLMPAAEPSAEAARSFDEKLAQLAWAQSQGMPGQIRLSEAEINSKIDAGLRDSPFAIGAGTLKGAMVHLEGDTIRALLQLDLKGKDLYVTVGGQLSLMNHAVALVPSEVRIGSLPVPTTLLEGKIDMHMDVPESISAVRVESGELVVETQ